MFKFASLPVAALALTFVAAPHAHANHQQAIQVETWYQQYLGRCADAPSMQAYVAALCRGRPGFEIEAELLGSDEYFQRNGCDNHLFIRALFRDVLGRGAYGEELEDWCRRLRRMDCRADLARRFIIEMRGRAPVAVTSGYAPVVQPVYVAPPQPTVVYREPVFVAPPVTVVRPAPIVVPPHHHHRPAFYGPPVRPGVSVNVRVPF